MYSALIIVFLIVYLSTWQRKNPVYVDAEKPNIRVKSRQYNLCTVVSEVLSLAGNPVFDRNY